MWNIFKVLELKASETAQGESWEAFQQQNTYNGKVQAYV